MTTAKICERIGCDVTVLRWLHPRFCSQRCAYLYGQAETSAAGARVPTPLDMVRAEGFVPEPAPTTIADDFVERPPSTGDAVATWIERHMPGTRLCGWQRDLVAQMYSHYLEHGRWPELHLGLLRPGKATVRRVLTDLRNQCEGITR